MIWAFDVDGTLIGSVRADRLRPGADELLAELTARDIVCVLWSAGGDEYAERSARTHGIHHHFVAFYAKAERDDGSRYVLDHLAPSHQPDLFVDDSPVDLPTGARIIAVPQFIGGNGADRALFDVLDRLDEIL